MNNYHTKGGVENREGRKGKGGRVGREGREGNDHLNCSQDTQVFVTVVDSFAGFGPAGVYFSCYTTGGL